VVETGQLDVPFLVVDADDVRVDPVTKWVRDLMLGDVSPRTCRSYY